MIEERTVRLVLACQNGDPHAIAELLDLYGGMAYTLIRRTLYPSSEIDDVYQEACINALASLHNLREPAKFAGWFKRIVIGKAIDHLRRRSVLQHVEQTTADPCLYSQVDNPETAVMDKYEQITVQNAVAELPLHYREVVVLYYWSDCSYADIADALHIPQGTVMSRLYKAKQLLAFRLGELHKEEGKLYGHRY